ncbi:MAG: DUF1488 family protein [Actinomycetota bacterium]
MHFAYNKLIVSRRRHQAVAAKKGKDIKQAEALLGALIEKRPHELKLVWREAYDRGQAWRKLLTEGMLELPPSVRDETLRTVSAPRSVLPGPELVFNNPRLNYDFDRDVVIFVGESFGSAVRCAISREALDDHFGTDRMNQKGRVEAVRERRSTIEQMARTKFLFWPVEDPEAVLIRTEEVPKLLKDARTLPRRPRSKSHAK